jgi:hypothetical protein
MGIALIFGIVEILAPGFIFLGFALGALALAAAFDPPVPPPAPAPTASTAPAPLWSAPEAPPPADYGVLTRRPPFSAARRPPPSAPAAPLAPAAARPGLLFDRYAVAGVMAAGAAPVALLRDTESGALLRLKAGDALDEAVLESVSMGELTFRAGEATVVAPVGERREGDP